VPINRYSVIRSPRTCFTEHREGPVDLLLTVDGRQLAERRRLTYESPSLRLGRGLSTLYVRQLDVLCQYAIDLQARQTTQTSPPVVGELDCLLATSLADGESDVPVHVYEDLFGMYRMQAPPVPSSTGNRTEWIMQSWIGRRRVYVIVTVYRLLIPSWRTREISCNRHQKWRLPDVSGTAGPIYAACYLATRMFSFSAAKACKRSVSICVQF